MTEIRGLKVYNALEEIEKPVDMVDVFRPKEELYGIAEKTIAINARVLWRGERAISSRSRGVVHGSTISERLASEFQHHS